MTYRIIGCAMRVHTALGPGLREKPYERALAVEFEEENIVNTGVIPLRASD